MMTLHHGWAAYTAQTKGASSLEIPLDFASGRVSDARDVVLCSVYILAIFNSMIRRRFGSEVGM